MSKLTMNDDGTITLPLRAGESVTIEEPSMRQLGRMHEIASAADDALPSLPVLSSDKPSPAEADEYTKVLKARTEMMFSAESPHAAALIEIIHLLCDREVTIDDLPGWCGNPATLRQILFRFQSPLPGPAADES